MCAVYAVARVSCGCRLGAAIWGASTPATSNGSVNSMHDSLNPLTGLLPMAGRELFEPLGLYGIWVKIRNYWKGWPFSY